MIARFAINSQRVVAAFENMLAFVSRDSRVAALLFVYFGDVEAIALNSAFKKMICNKTYCRP